MRVVVTAVALAGLLVAGSCAKVPPPTQEELYARDQWAVTVTEDDRKTVLDEVELHTGWSEKRKVLYELQRFQHIAKAEDRKARWAEQEQKKAATRATTRPATRSTTRSTTRSSTRPTTRRHTTRPGTTAPVEEDMED